MTRALKIDESLEGEKYVITLDGRLDTNTSAQMDAVASRIYATDVDANIVVDMRNCTFVSSAGLRVIATMQKRSTRGGSLRFRNVPTDVMSIFRATGFDDILTFD